MAVLLRLEGTKWLMASLLYGAGLKVDGMPGAQGEGYRFFVTI